MDLHPIIHASQAHNDITELLHSHLANLPPQLQLDQLTQLLHQASTANQDLAH
jgi:hypothetical protein